MAVSPSLMLTLSHVKTAGRATWFCTETGAFPQSSTRYGSSQHTQQGCSQAAAAQTGKIQNSSRTPQHSPAGYRHSKETSFSEHEGGGGFGFCLFVFFFSCSSLKVHLGLVFPAPRGQWTLLLLFSGWSLAKHSSPICSGKECLQQNTNGCMGEAAEQQ